MKGPPPRLRTLEGERPGERSPISHRQVPAPVRMQGRRPPRMPAGLPPDAQRMWRRVVPELQAVGIVDGVDEMALEAMVTMYARMREARRIFAAHGPLTTGSQGQLVAHPMLAVERAAAQLVLRYLEQFARPPVIR